ncbi:MAG TPA: DNA polymerase III subunit alpha, partial [Candidatus Acetothermia bacterium]|nr:DNA polymerase III subunit alpha [Candidatus Acetothermia bacterium]
YEKADRIAKKIPFGHSLAQALETIPELRELSQRDEEAKRLFSIASRLEGLLRNASTHAAGVVISPEPLERYVPLLRLPDGQFVTQFDMHDLEALGLLKMDFLGLRNLTLLADVCQWVKARTGRQLELSQIPLDDAATFQLIREGRTSGVFQLESAGMRALIRRLEPERFQELVAILALYRPGPLESGMAEDYIERKHGRQPISYPHPALEEVLQETYGLPIYQDQVMLMAQRLAGFTLAEADLLRKAMGKKKPEVMAEMEARFVAGCVKNGIPEPEARQIFADIEKFARYGFNKAHATSYAFISYWTAYFKAHYPTEFMAALLSSVGDNTDKVAAYVAECREMGIEVLPPDINESDVDFTPLAGGKIRFGLAAIKHVGRGAVEAILEARRQGPFQGFFDFCQRVDPERVPRDTIEHLIKAGAFDRFGPSRKGLLALVDEGLRLAQLAKKERLTGQQSFFGAEELVPKLPVKEEEFSRAELLRFEKELLGLFLSGHPLDEHREQLGQLGVVSLREAEGKQGTFRVAGRVKAAKVISTASGRLAFLTLEDGAGEVEAVVRSRLYEATPGWFSPEALLLLRVRWEERNGGRRLVVEEAQPLASSPQLGPSRLVIELPVELAVRETVGRLATALANFPGTLPVHVKLTDGS